MKELVKIIYKLDLLDHLNSHYLSQEINQGQELYEGTVVDLVIGKGLGAGYIIVPNLPSDGNYRIMIKSSDNIFFDVNNSYLTK